jgi:hypothetical protein
VGQFEDASASFLGRVSRLSAAHLAADQGCYATGQGKRDLLTTILNHCEKKVGTLERGPHHDVHHVGHDREQYQQGECSHEQEAIGAIRL